jgi:pyruvate dehydrogenase E2 component (dihydrolipoamide acetyltransferase)
MPFEIRIPRLGWTMERGIFGDWLKRDGDRIEEGMPLFTIEGDKASCGSPPTAPRRGCPWRSEL